jgi:hypothetical protein
MFNPFKREEDRQLDVLINRVIDDMELYGPDSEEYPRLVETLKKLYKLKAQQKPRRVSPDTVLIVLGNILGILVIVAYEEKHVITSKAYSTFVKRN